MNMDRFAHPTTKVVQLCHQFGSTYQQSAKTNKISEPSEIIIFHGHSPVTPKTNLLITSGLNKPAGREHPSTGVTLIIRLCLKGTHTQELAVLNVEYCILKHYNRGYTQCESAWKNSHQTVPK